VKDYQAESHRKLTRNVHLSHWKQFGPGAIPWEKNDGSIPLNFTNVIKSRFHYSEQDGWSNVTYPFIPPMEGEDVLGHQFPRESYFAKFFNDVSQLSW